MNGAQFPDLVENITRRPNANDVVKKLLGDLSGSRMADGGQVPPPPKKQSPEQEATTGQGLNNALNEVQVTPGVFAELLGRLINRRDGGSLVDGQGDGRSDDVVASLHEQGDVRLSRGEYIVPADVVAALGDGSTDAGAEKLNGMVEQWRQEYVDRVEEYPAPGENDG